MNWIVEITDINDAKKTGVHCKFCNCTLVAQGGRKDLLFHANSAKHQRNMHSLDKQSDVRSVFSTFNSLKKKIVQAEIGLSAFCVEHNISFATMDHLTMLCKSIFDDSEIAKGMHCKRTKATAIVQNVLGKQQTEDLTELVRKNKFSILADESTDISSSKLLSIVVRVSVNFKINDFFWDLIEIEKADAETLYKTIVKSFSDRGIDIKNNLVGYGADGANVMMGNKNSVATLLTRDCPRLFVLKCVCHSFALCSSYACAKLPDIIEKMAREIYNFIQNSPKRISEFAKIQCLLDIKPLKLLQPSQTRWLSLEAVVKRILELYDAIKVYFNMAALADNITNAADILSTLKDPTTLLYFKFLSYILPIINGLNRLFQSESPQIYRLSNDMQVLMKTVLKSYLQAEYVNGNLLSAIDFRNPRRFLKLENMYLGAAVKRHLENDENNSLTSQALNKFQLNCLEFYLELTAQIFKRFNFDDSFLKSLKFIDPQIVMSGRTSEIMFTPLINTFPDIINDENIQTFDDEKRTIENLNFSEMFNIGEDIPVEFFWSNVLKLRNMNGQIMFPIMSKLVSAILSLPHSSAAVERVFSQINLNKTKQRNALKVKTLSGILHTKNYLKMNSTECHTLKVPQKTLDKLSSLMYTQ